MEKLVKFLTSPLERSY